MNLMELDVQLSKDGHPIVAHDSDLGRMCGPEYQNKLISDYNYADLPEIQRRVTMHLTEGDFEMQEGETARFLLLEDLFKEFETASILFSIDMKNRS